MPRSSRSKLYKHSDEGEVVNTDEDNEWVVIEEIPNTELENKLEKKMQRREGYSERDKMYRSTEKGRKRDDIERADRHRTSWAREDTDRRKRSRDHISSHRHTSSRDGSPFYDDRASRYKDNKDARRDNNNTNKNRDEISEHRSRSIHDRHLSDKAYIDDLSVRKRLKSEPQLSPSSTGNVSSHLPPRPSVLGKSVDPNLGRTQTSWNSFPNWSYNPFHHVPPPMFNPYMYQIVPPMLGGLPVNMSYPATPYHYTGVTEWNGQSLESNVVSVDSQPAVQKTEDSVHGLADDVWSGLMGPQIEDEEKNLDFNNPEVRKVTKSSHVSMDRKDDNTLVSRVYLSKIDVSKELTSPELFSQIINMLDLDQESPVSDESDFKILFSKEGIKDDDCNGPSFFAEVDDSVYKKAMSLYTKQRVRFTATGSRSVEDQEKESCEPSVADCEVNVKDSCNDNVDEVKVKDSCNNDDGSKEDGGPLLVLTDLPTSQLTEFGSVNLS